MRSRNHSLPAICTARPKNVIHGSNTTKPHIRNGNPAALMTLSTNGAVRCRGGNGADFRRAQKVSPITDREAQWSSVRGGGNTRGFTTVQITHKATGSSDHQPIHARLQMAATSSAGIGMRV